ncbi:MAG: ATP-binding cassette domain-containing protein [Syntrophomonadaceae bacterium]|jgi:tungstate transport system ATP-binding protein
MMPAFRLHKVIKKYGSREVLNIDDLVLSGSRIYTILGPNGSGKTTLMRVMSLLTKNDYGNVEVLGEKINWSKSQLERLRRQMTMVTQTAFMFEGSVFYNVAYGLRVRKRSKTEVKQAVQEALHLLGMSKFVQTDARTLSGGERQKVAIARAVALKPRILFLDEPTANIDPQSAIDIEKYIKLINQEFKTTIILVTHNLFQAKRLADEVFFMWDGKIVERGSNQDIFQNSQDKRTRAFLTGETVF